MTRSSRLCSTSTALSNASMGKTTCQLSGEQNTKSIVHLFHRCNELGLEAVGAESSSDAGRYLCEYVMYKSLRSFRDRRALFIHVPDATTKEKVGATSINSSFVRNKRTDAIAVRLHGGAVRGRRQGDPRRRAPPVGRAGWEIVRLVSASHHSSPFTPWPLSDLKMLLNAFTQISIP